MALLALDLGTKTGFAVSTRAGVVSGVRDFKPSRFASSAMRFVHFKAFLQELHDVEPIDHVVYEEVRRHVAVDAAHAYGGFQSHLLVWCEERQIPAEGYPVGTIKRFWTGKGNADKAAMIAEALRRGHRVADDNEADALAMLYMAAGGAL